MSERRCFLPPDAFAAVREYPNLQSDKKSEAW